MLIKIGGFNMKLSKKIIAITLMCSSIPLCSNNIVANAAQNEDVNSSYDTVDTVQTSIDRIVPAFRWMVEVTSGSGATVYTSPGGGHKVGTLPQGDKVHYAGETREVNGEKWYKISAGWVSERSTKLYYILI
jgi:hypothetical protein